MSVQGEIAKLRADADAIREAKAFAVIARVDQVDPEVMAALRELADRVPDGVIDLGPLVLPPSPAGANAMVGRRLQIGADVVVFAVWVEP